MLIPPTLLQQRWSLNPQTIVHVGGHHAEELDDYLAMGWGSQRVLWVEAMSGAAEKIRDRIAHLPNHVVAHAVVWSHSAVQVTFRETSNGQSSSVLRLKSHLDHYPEIIVTEEEDRITTTLADLSTKFAINSIDLLNLDIQGAELQALQGLGPALAQVSAIYSEVNVEELYEGCALISELDDWLAQRGFVLVDLELTSQGWGDGLWIRRDQLPPWWRLRKLRRNLPEQLRKSRNAVLGWAARHLGRAPHHQ